MSAVQSERLGKDLIYPLVQAQVRIGANPDVILVNASDRGDGRWREPLDVIELKPNPGLLRLGWVVTRLPSRA